MAGAAATTGIVCRFAVEGAVDIRLADDTAGYNDFSSDVAREPKPSAVTAPIPALVGPTAVDIAAPAAPAAAGAGAGVVDAPVAVPMFFSFSHCSRSLAS